MNEEWRDQRTETPIEEIVSSDRIMCSLCATTSFISTLYVLRNYNILFKQFMYSIYHVLIKRPDDVLVITAALAVSITLLGCNENGRLEGDVYIVTEEQAVTKLALVEVKAVDVSVMESYLEERYNASMEKMDGLMPKLRRLVQKLDSLYSQRRELGDVSLMQVGLSEEKEASVGDEVVVFASVNDVAFLNSGYGGGEIQRVHNGDRATVLDTAGEWGRSRTGPGYYKLDFGDKIGWLDANELVLAEDYDQRARKRRLDEEIFEVRTSIQELKDKIKDVRSESYYFQKLPSAEACDTTGSEGGYALDLSPDTYYLVASSERNVDDHMENYFWIVKTNVSEGRKTLDLDNSNMGWLAQKKYALSEEEMNQIDANMLLAVQPGQEMDPQEHVRSVYEAAFP